MPFALEEIRKFGVAGHRVFTTDTFSAAPGNHSKYVEAWFVTASPRYDTARFLAGIEEVIEAQSIELLVPAFEEVFYLARNTARFREVTHLFAPTFETLARLHDKNRFLELCRELGIAAPEHHVVVSEEELLQAVKSIPRYFARPAFSRGGVELLTNHGPLAGAMSLEDAHPTPEQPWVVQPFIEGEDVCSFSIVHRGRVAAHSAYVHPKMLEHAGGIVFESVVEPTTLAVTQRIAEATDYHGQLSLDFMRTPQGLVAIECNPRPTAGVTVMPTEMFDEAMFRPRLDRPRVAPAGLRRKMTPALLRDMLVEPAELVSDIDEIMSDDPDVYAARGDMKPFLYAFLSYGHVLSYRWRTKRASKRRTDLMAGYFHDISWDGDELPALSGGDAERDGSEGLGETPIASTRRRR